MIKGFEEHTAPLKPEQMEIVYWIERLFTGGTEFTVPSSSKPVKAPILCRAIQDMFEPSFKESTLRQCINWLRQNGSVPILSSSKGYWTTRDTEEIRDNIDSLEQRANSIQTAADGLRRFV
jgi:hypothetical protein